MFLGVKTRHLHIIAIILILVAGFLWSRKLATQTLEASRNRLLNSNAEQIAIIRQKIEQKTDPIELADFGRKFLLAGNAEAAILPLERATKLKPNYRDAWYLLGYAYAKLAGTTGDLAKRTEALDRARAAVDEALVIDPVHRLSQELRAELER